MNNKLKTIGGAFATVVYWALAGAIVALFIEQRIDRTEKSSTSGWGRWHTQPSWAA